MIDTSAVSHDKTESTSNVGEVRTGLRGAVSHDKTDSTSN